MAVHLKPQQQFQMASTLAIAGSGCGVNQAATLLQQMVPPTMLSELKSNLNSTISGSRKRARDEPPSPSNTLLMQQQMHQQFLLQRHQPFLLDQIPHKTTQAAADLRIDSGRLIDSAVTSTSGRRLVVEAAPEHPSSAAFPVHNDNVGTISASGSSCLMIPMTKGHSMDALLRLRAEQLRSGIEVACKRHCRAIIAAMEQQAHQRLAEKQAELEAASKKNAELEERLRQAAAESQAWFDVAKNSEALVAKLRASLEQALVQRHIGKNSDNFNCAPSEDLSGAAHEGYGDSEEEAASAAASTAVTSSVLRAETTTAERVLGERWVYLNAFLGSNYGIVFRD